MEDRIDKPKTFPITLNLPFNVDPTKIKFQQVRIKRVLTANCLRHFRINADFELLDINVAKIYFEKVKKDLTLKSPPYCKIWKIKEFFFPIILLDVFSCAGNVLCILSLNLRNYNYLPPQVGLFKPNMQLFKEIDEEAIIPDEKGKIHLKKHPRGVWFCTPGTNMYHDFYYDIDRWELERYNKTCEIVEIVNRVIAMIDRSRDCLDAQRN